MLVEGQKSRVVLLERTLDGERKGSNREMREFVAGQLR
jgi:hypothetical protein